MVSIIILLLFIFRQYLNTIQIDVDIVQNAFIVGDNEEIEF